MHTVPTSILHSLEGMPGLDWAKLLKLQSSDGSFLFSPAATAQYALMNTGDKKCFDYIDRTVKKFNGGGQLDPWLYIHACIHHIMHRCQIAQHFCTIILFNCLSSPFQCPTFTLWIFLSTYGLLIDWSVSGSLVTFSKRLKNAWTM